MPVNYYTQDCCFRFKGRRATTDWIRRTAQREGKTLGAISVVFCSDAALLEINRRYQQHDYMTDIITFDYSEGTTISGDLMISIDTVRSNAEIFHVSFEEEIMRVIIHGILHLCGYGDKTPAEEQRMRALENRYLAIRGQNDEI